MAGESCHGRFVPIFTFSIVEWNRRAATHGSDKANLKGVIILADDDAVERL